MIAAYALALQSLLAVTVLAQAAAQQSQAASLFVICTSHQTDTGTDGALPKTSEPHCSLCTLSGSPLAALPDLAALPLWQVGPPLRLSLAANEAFQGCHSVRAGLSRAPPQSA